MLKFVKQNKITMKKRILVLAAIFGASASFAQVTSLKNKKGFEILPQAGDYAIAVDATPILNFGLNVVKMGANTGDLAGGTFNSPDGANLTVWGKYFTSSTQAYRATVGINTMTTTTESITLYGADNDEEYITTQKDKMNFITLGGGMEWRRGHNRLQGFYGAMANIRIGSPTTLTSFEYNLDIEEAVEEGVETSGVARNLGVSKSSSFGIGLGGFVGVEYFVLPKISIGGEFTWGLSLDRARLETTTETYTSAPVDEEVTTITKQAVPNSFSLANGASVNVMAIFHF